MNPTKKITTIAQQLRINAQQADFAGDDPFDGLNATLFRALPFLQNTWIGLAWTQFHKRSPINLRRLFGIPKKRNPKGVALFISGMVLEYQRTQDSSIPEKAKELANWLTSAMCDQDEWGAPCWGYHFPWKARAFFVPLGKPNLITTVYVSKALFELGKLCNDEKLVEIALSSADFMVDKLYRESSEGNYFCYIPGESALVHNANLWAAAWVLKSALSRKNENHAKIALNACETSLQAQQENGSWAYGARSHHQFIDGFHTGYNLETLYMMHQDLEAQPEAERIRKAIESGFSYYKANLFTPDGIAKYYHNNQYPLDTHNFMQAIMTLIKLSDVSNVDSVSGDKKQNLALAERVLKQCIDQLYQPDQQRFIYQRNASVTNSIDYIRWTQSWAYYGINDYLNHISKGNDSCNDLK